MSTRVDFDPPVSPGFPCTNCGQPLVAVAEIQDGPVALDWTRSYDWRHEVGLTLHCSVPQRAIPFDALRAGRAVRERLVLATPEYLLQQTPLQEALEAIEEATP